MLGIPLRYVLKHPITGIAALAADPIETWTTVREAYAEGREERRPQCPYEPDLSWEQELHKALGVSWACDETSKFLEIWYQVMRELEAKGIRPGPESFQWWNDGDAALVRAIWCLVRHLRPKTVVETGVAHGVTSRIILEALSRNGDGHLWSIDRPPLEKSWRQQVGMAVGDGHADRWTYIKGSSRRRLPRLLEKLGKVDLFIHDSLHSDRNVRFELDQIWPILGPNGVVVVDDIDANWAFRSFSQTIPGQRSLICEAEPLRLDLRRFNKKGLFGIMLKTPMQ
jgi:hypothetical protein